MVSIREVAKMAGVSPSTVSRVMNKTVKVNEEKTQRVLAAIKKTGFKPNELARALYKKSSKMIGIIVPNIDNPFFSELAKAVEEEAFRGGYKILLCNSNDDGQKEMANIEMLNQMKADGIVIMTNCDSTGKAIADCDLPVVVADRRLSGGGEVACIEADHYEGGVMAMNHLLKCGCKNIVCMRGPQELSSGMQRYKGYRDTCLKYGMKEQWVDCRYSHESGLKAAGELLKKYPGTDGIIACNDIVAMAVYKILHKEGLRVPEDVQIIGFDNIRFSRLFVPELTTIGQPIAEMGTLAARIIIDAVQGKPFQKENIFKVRLIKRQTTREEQRP